MPQPFLGLMPRNLATIAVEKQPPDERNGRTPISKTLGRRYPGNFPSTFKPPECLPGCSKGYW